MKAKWHMTIYTYYILCSHLLHLLCEWCVTHVTLFIAMHICIHGISLIQDWLTFMTLKTQFSGTTCLIAMKLIHAIKGGV